MSCGGRRRRGVCLVWYIADRGGKKFGIQNLVGGSGRLLSHAIEISQHPSHVYSSRLLHMCGSTRKPGYY